MITDDTGLPLIDVPVIVIGLMADGTQRCAIRPPAGLSYTVGDLAMLLGVAITHVISSQMRSGVDPNEAVEVMLGLVGAHTKNVVDAWLAGDSGVVRP